MSRPGKVLSEALRIVLQEPVTENYPFEPANIPDKFRGKLAFSPDKCVGCKLCMKDCPSNAIFINKTPENVWEAIVQLDRCLYCGQCAESCVKKALEMTKVFELAAIDKKTLRVNISVQPAEVK
ncbi:MAG: 4Fe-4S dicluster domain-containing protein [Candidatus Riflebacteria bacterium]|nr:4Fe-4S dicluster domain-containing protein [Candidatus Riflebacteria bacterium]